MRRKLFEKGQSLFELVVAIAISAIIIMAIVSLVTNSIRNAIYSRNNAKAVSYSQQLTEWLRVERDTDIAEFLTNAQTPVWCFEMEPPTWSSPGECGSKTIGGMFTRKANFETSTVYDLGVDKTVVHIDVIVEWNDSSGTHTITNSTDLTDWRQR